MKPIRISCALLAYIKIDGKYLLGINKGNLNRGEICYTPLGGCIEINQETKEFLIEKYEAVFEKKNDLRLWIKEKYLDDFKQWFNSKQKRELSIIRELLEELTNDNEPTKIFNITEISENDIIEESYSSKCFQSEWDNVTTQYFFEIRKISFTEKVTNKIKDQLDIQYVKNGLDYKKFILLDEKDLYNNNLISQNCKHLII